MINPRSISFCKPDLMSVCTADSRNDQQECIFYEKANNENRCMYFVFNEYCDCLNAQLYAGNKLFSD